MNASFENNHPDGLKPDQKIGAQRYTLICILGKGGMGVVWLARDERLQEELALKFLAGEISHDKEALDDMRRETLKSRKLSHPNIIRIHDLFEGEGEAPFITMEYIDGKALNTLKAEQEQRLFAWDFLQPLVQQLCSALDYAHSQRIIHRDLKPGNMILDAGGALKLADFGLAASAADSISRLSRDLGASGTPAYMSPQQMRGQAPQVSDDIYALGATLYELLTSKPPFFRGDIYRQVKEEPPTPLDERLSELELDNAIPDDVAALIMACLSKEPEQRPQSAAAVAQWIGLEVKTPATGTLLSAQAQLEQFTVVTPDHTWESTVNEQDSPEVESPRTTDRKGSLVMTLATAAIALLCLSFWFFALRGSTTKSGGGEKPGTTTPKARKVEKQEGNNSTAQVSAASDNKPLQTIDLLALIDLAKDRVDALNFTGSNRWSRSSTGSLIYHSDGKAGKIITPVAIDADDYSFEIAFQRKDSAGQFHINLPIDAAPTKLPIILDKPGHLFITGKAGTAWPDGLPNTGRITLRCKRVDGGASRVTATFDGKTICEWTGNLREHGKMVEGHPEFPGRLLISLFCRRNGYEFSSFVLRVYDGKATVLR